MEHRIAATRVSAAARLHLGFLDPDASRGRRFGSLGLALEGIDTVVRVRPGKDTGVRFEGHVDARVRALAGEVIQHFRLPGAVVVELEREIPRHVGLGSGTQLALAIGSALTHAAGVKAPAAEIARVLRRGKRSGIGLGLFERGGIILDAGHGPATVMPPVVSHFLFPPAWRVVLISDRDGVGLNGPAEIAAFRALAPLPASAAATLCHLTLMGVLPAVAETDFEAFGAALGEIQAIVGDHFATAQNGRFTSAAVATAAEFCLNTLGLPGVGQTSWGPTGFVFVPDEAAAQALVTRLAQECVALPQLEFRIAAARNRGADIDGEPD